MTRVQIEDVNEFVYETCGQYWPCIHQYICFAIILMQITMIGLFGLKSKPEASIATLPLLILTIFFNEYCKLRFLPSFQHYSIQVPWVIDQSILAVSAEEDDELDAREGRLKCNSDNAVIAYRPPCLRPVNFIEAESGSSDQQLEI
ncbi:hypothetical protein Ancab_025643 [Ancistrocladus abbreviatus]